MKQTFVPLAGICLHLGLALAVWLGIWLMLRDIPADSDFSPAPVAACPVLVILMRLARRCCVIAIGRETLEVTYPLRIFDAGGQYDLEGISSVSLSLSDPGKNDRGTFLSVLLRNGFPRNVLFGDPYNALYKHMFWRRQQLQIAAALRAAGLNAFPENETEI